MRICLSLLPLITSAAFGLAGDQAQPVSLRLTPPSLLLEGPRDLRRVLVTGVAADGSTFDLSSEAKYETPEGVTIDPSGFFHPGRDGKYVVKVTAGAQAVDLPVEVSRTTEPSPVSFVRDVMPAISRVGCNAGTCHGSAKGKKGFKLSLRGYDPDYDYAQLIDDLA